MADGDPHRRSISHSIEQPVVLGGKKTSTGLSSDDDSIAPTDEELHSLRRVSDKIPLKAFTIAFVELVERLSYYGTVQVFTNFIQQPNPGTATGKALDPSAPDAQPGALPPEGHGDRRHAYGAVFAGSSFYY